MKLFNLFKKSTTTTSVENDTDLPELNEEENLSTLNHKDYITIKYGTGMAIDVIYNYIEHDYEQDGYNDAMVSSVAEYCIQKENIILNNLQQLINRVQLRYKGEIKEIDVRIANAQALFALASVSLLSARRDMINEHIEEIRKMEEKLQTKAPEMMTMIDSYRRGFMKGCAAQTENFLSPTHVTA